MVSLPSVGSQTPFGLSLCCLVLEVVPAHTESSCLLTEGDHKYKTSSLKIWFERVNRVSRKYFMSRLLYVWSLILDAKSLLRHNEVWCGQVLLAEGCWDKGTKMYWQSLQGQQEGKCKHKKSAYSCVCAACPRSTTWNGSIAHTAHLCLPRITGACT